MKREKIDFTETKRQLIKDFVAGKKTRQQVVTESFSPLVLMCRDGGFLVHRIGDVTESGAPIRQYYSADEFEKIRPHFNEICFIPERDPE